MHGVVLTPGFERDAKNAGLSEEGILDIAVAISADPAAGDLIVGTGGARKLRHRGHGTGKRGGYRTIHYFGGDDVPIFLLAVYRKGDRDNLSKTERNTLASILPRIAQSYRKRKQT